MTITVRALTPDDASLYASLRLLALNEYPHHFTTSSYAAESALSEQAWKNKLAASCHYGGFSKGELMAILEVKNMGGSHAHLAGVFALLRGQGLGKKLVKGTLEILQARGVNYCTATVPETNPKAFGFYECLGFAPEGHYVQRGVGKTTYGVNLLSAPGGAAGAVFQQDAELG